MFLSQYRRARCNVPSKVLAIAHATMTLFTGGISRISKISRFSRISRKWSDSPFFSRVWGFSKTSRISKFSRISRKWTFLKRPLFQKTPLSEPDLCGIPHRFDRTSAGQTGHSHGTNGTRPRDGCGLEVGVSRQISLCLLVLFSSQLLSAQTILLNEFSRQSLMYS